MLVYTGDRVRGFITTGGQKFARDFLLRFVSALLCFMLANLTAFVFQKPDNGNPNLPKMYRVGWSVEAFVKSFKS